MTLNVDFLAGFIICFALICFLQAMVRLWGARENLTAVFSAPAPPRKFVGNRILGVWFTTQHNDPSSNVAYYRAYPVQIETDTRIEWRLVEHRGEKVLWPFWQGVQLLYDEEE